MNFDWPTFLLEVLNFFILLWILQRFLYRPIQEVIQARRQKIEAQLQAASATQAAAAAARLACETRLAAWDQEQAQARNALEQEISAERERLLERVNQDVSEARARNQAKNEHERQAWQRMTEQRAIELGGQFVRKLLGRVASPGLEDSLVAGLLADFSHLPAAEADHLKSALDDDGLEVISAFPLPESRRTALTEAFAQLAGGPVQPVFREDPTLLSGLLIQTGSRKMAANLRDELRFFRDIDGPGVA
jgi:F-type H+-transporting ATPase subunit b